MSGCLPNGRVLEPMKKSLGMCARCGADCGRNGLMMSSTMLISSCLNTENKRFVESKAIARTKMVMTKECDPVLGGLG